MLIPTGGYSKCAISRSKTKIKNTNDRILAQLIFYQKISKKSILVKPHNMQILGSFQGLCPLYPHQGSALDPLGGLQRIPRPPAVWAMTFRHCVRAVGTHPLLPKNISDRETPPLTF